MGLARYRTRDWPERSGSSLIASILDKYVTGKLAEREVIPSDSQVAARPSKARSA